MKLLTVRPIGLRPRKWNYCQSGTLCLSEAYLFRCSFKLKTTFFFYNTKFCAPADTRTLQSYQSLGNKCGTQNASLERGRFATFLVPETFLSLDLSTDIALFENDTRAS